MGKISHFQDKLCTSGSLKLGKEIRMFPTEVNSKARMITGLKLFCLSLFWNRKYKEQKTHAWMFLSSDKILVIFVSKSFCCGTVDILILYNFSTVQTLLWHQSQSINLLYDFDPYHAEYEYDLV